MSKKMNAREYFYSVSDRSYVRPKVYYDVESLYNVFTAVFIDEKTGHKYLVYDGNVEVTQEDVDYLGLTLINRSQANRMAWARQLVGFANRGYDDYILAAYFNGADYRAINELSKKLIHTRKPPFLWKDKPEDLFSRHTIDIQLYINKYGISLKQLASEMGLNVEEFELDFDLDVDLTKEEIMTLIEYNVNDVVVTEALFNHDTVQIWYNQHVAVIEKYLPGAAWAIFMTNATLSERALTQHRKLSVQMADTFQWTFNGLNVFEEVDLPKQWKEVVLDYATAIEEGVKQYKEHQGGSLTDRELGQKYIQSIPNPEIDPIQVTDHFYVNPGLGGIHSDYVDENGLRTLARAEHVLNSDIGGAYGSLAVPTRQFGDATKIYKVFMEDKNKTKYASMEILDADFDQINVKEFLAYIEEKYDVDTKGLVDKDEIVSQILMEREASKLGTNDSTGKSDQPGSYLYNPIVVKQNRITLQFLLYELITQLAKAGATLYSANTDGVFYKGDEAVLRPIVDAWRDKWGFEVDTEVFDLYIAKDDNNRILVQNGEVVEVSGELRHHEFDANYPSAVPRLVDVVITDKLIHPEKSIRELIEAHKDQPDLFAWTVKATKNHLTAIDYELAQRINRVFLTTEGVTIQNYSVTNDRIDKFNNLDLDNTVTLINKEIPKQLPDNIDLDAYERLITERFNNWQ